MSYNIYTTEGIILKQKPLGEANIVAYVLTEELGLIMASAQSARAPYSKLKGSLGEYSYLSISCIKGKNGWKITSVKDIDNFFFNYPDYSHKVLARVSSLLLQMITGESPHPEIFQTVRTGFENLNSVKENEIEIFEALIVLRILYLLGYVAKSDLTEEFLNNTLDWDTELLKKVAENKTNIISLINKALKESHL